MQDYFKKICSFLLVLLLVFSFMPVKVFEPMVQAAELNQSTSLAEAVSVANEKSFTKAVYGKDSNAITILKNYLASKSITDIEVSIAEAGDIVPSNSYANIRQDGSLDYFYVDPSNILIANTGFTNVKVAFTLTDTSGTTSKTEPLTIQLGWDEAKVKEYIEANTLANFSLVDYIKPNTDLANLTQNFSLPSYSDDKHLIITWASDNPAISLGSLTTETINGSFVQSYPVTVKQSGEDQVANIRATFKYNRGTSDISITKNYQVIIPAIDLSKIKAEMQNDLDNYFTYDVLKYSYPNAAESFDPNHVLYDIQLPASSAIRRDMTVDGKLVSKGISDLYSKYITSGTGFSFYSFENPAEASDSGITLQGYRAIVQRPKAEEKPITVNLTMVLKHKDYDLSVEKTLPLTINPVNYADLMAKVDRKITLLELVKENFFDIINSNPSKIGPNSEAKNTSENEISNDLSSFTEVRFKNPEDLTDNTLEYIYTEAEKMGDGVVLKALPGWENQEAWRLLKSSNPRYLAHESLNLVQKPKYDTPITIEAMLTVPEMEAYENYFSPDTVSADADKLASLFNQTISQKVTILGEEGPAPEEHSKTIKAGLIIEGSKLIETKADHETAHQEWFNQSFEIPKDTAIVDFVKQTLETDTKVIDLKLSSSGWLDFLNVEGFPLNETGKTNGASSSWMWYVKHKGEAEFSAISSLDRKDGSAYLEDGDIVKLKFINDPLYPSTVREQAPKNPIDLKELTKASDWTGFRGNAENETPTRAVSETPAISREANWNYTNQDMKTSEWGDYPAPISDLISLDKHLYYATLNKLYKLDSQGKVVARLELAGEVEYTTRLAYDKGLLIIPLQGGGVEAVDPAKMTSQWVTESIDSFKFWTPKDPNNLEGEWKENSYELQSAGTTYIDSSQNIAYVTLSSPGSEVGIIRAIDLSTGKQIWRHENKQTGYYWSGPTKVGDYILIGNNAGQIEVIDENGDLVADSETFGTGIRSTLVQADSKIYFTSTDGLLHSLEFNPDTLSFDNHQKVKFASGSTSTPTIYQGKAYVGGIFDSSDFYSPGVFAVIDLASMSIEYINEELSGQVQSAPLVLYDSAGNVFVYFTANGPEGFLHVYHDGQVDITYRPNVDQADYTNASPILDAGGNIYYSTGKAIISLSNKNAEVADFTLSYGVDPRIGQMQVSLSEETMLDMHSSFNITDTTENIKLFYDEDISEQVGNVKYTSFRTNFYGKASNNPLITVSLQLEADYLPLEKGQAYKLYKLIGSDLIEVDLKQANLGQRKGLSLSMKPLLATLMDSQMQTRDHAIIFSQALKDNTNYILVAVEASTENTSSVNPPSSQSQTNQLGENQTGQPGQNQTGQPGEDQTGQLGQGKVGGANQLAKTGEINLFLPFVSLLSLGLVGIMVRKQVKKED